MKIKKQKKKLHIRVISVFFAILIVFGMMKVLYLERNFLNMESGLLPAETDSQDTGTNSQDTGFASSRRKDKNVIEAENRGILTLVNQTLLIPSDWSVDLVQLKNNQAIDRRAYKELQSMMDDARALGLDPLICSSYRSMEKQTELYKNKVGYFTDAGYSRTEAEVLASEYVSAPGTSEHQLGLAVDICSEAYQLLETDQENTAVQQWLMANCWRYGFILRYPKDKIEITGVSYEPWHYRYVGVEAAKEIYDEGLCLEEYLDLKK